MPANRHLPPPWLIAPYLRPALIGARIDRLKKMEAAHD